MSSRPAAEAWPRPPGHPGNFFPNWLTIQIRADPIPDCQFLNWTGDLDDPGQAANRSVEISMFRPRTVTANFKSLKTIVTIVSSPPGRNVTVDGVSYVAPRNFEWKQGEVHAIGTGSPQSDGATRYRFVSWSDGKQQTHGVTIPDVPAITYTVTYIPQYVLTTKALPSGNGSGGATPYIGDRYYDAGTEVTLKANPVGDHPFREWTGDLAGAANPGKLKMEGPRTVTANFDTKVRVTTSPAGRKVKVNGVEQTAPYTISPPRGPQLRSPWIPRSPTGPGRCTIP